MRTAAVLAMVSVCGCVTAEKHRVRAAPGLTAEPGLTEPPAETAPSSALGAAIESVPTAEAPSEDAWQFSLSPFLWPTGVTVSAGEGGSSERAHSSTRDLVPELKAVGMLRGEARRGRFFAFGEFVLFDLTADLDKVAPAPGRGFSTDGEIEVAEFIGLLAAGWRFVELPLDSDDPSKVLALEGYAGVRYTRGRVAVDADVVGPRGATREIDRAWTPAWWDPVVGTRIRVGLMHDFDLTARVELGGFGVGAEHAAYVSAGFDWRLTDVMSIEFGWAEYAVHYEEGGGPDPFVLNEHLYGPYFALTFRF